MLKPGPCRAGQRRAGGSERPGGGSAVPRSIRESAMGDTVEPQAASTRATRRAASGAGCRGKAGSPPFGSRHRVAGGRNFAMPTGAGPACARPCTASPFARAITPFRDLL